MKSPYISLNTSAAFKGIFTVMVLLSHLKASVTLFNIGILGTALSAFGYLGVSGFFFLSGYGLCTSYRTKKEGYINTLLQRKWLPLYLINILFILLYTLRDVLCYRFVSRFKLMQSFFIFKTVVDKGWYIQVQCLLYLVFFAAFKFFKSDRLKILITFILSAVYIAVCGLLGLDSTWYETVICFGLGVLYSYTSYKRIFGGLLLKIFTPVLFLIALYLGNVRLLPDVFRIFIKIISAGLFCCILLLTARCINFRFKPLELIGKYSLEIYLTQGLFLNLFHDTFVIKNEIAYILCVLLGTLILSLALHPVITKIRNIKLLKGG